MPQPSFFICTRPRRAAVAGFYADYIWHFPQDHAIQGVKYFWRDLAGVAWRLKKTVVLVGMMGAGKTAVGSQLARVLGVPFVDSDDEIERAANMTIAEIFARDGEEFFRHKESQVLARLLRGRPCVLSTGGGAYLAEANRQAISDQGVAVWLKAELDLLWQRVRHRATRPLLRTADPRGTLARLNEARVPVYEFADVTVEAREEYSIEMMADRVVEALAHRPDVLEKR